MQNDTHKAMLPLFLMFFLSFGQHKCTKLHKHLITFIVYGDNKSIQTQKKQLMLRTNMQGHEHNLDQDIWLRIIGQEEIRADMEAQFWNNQADEQQHQGNFLANQQNQIDNARQRYDADLAQNISSATSTQIGNQLAWHKNKYQKEVVKQIYKQFLKENCKVNSQLILIFSYLFLLKNFVEESGYVQFNHKLLNYLEKRWIFSDSIQDPEVRNSLKFKINIHKQLLNLLFGLRGKFIPNFNELKELVAPLFTRTQANLPQRPFQKAQKIQEEIMASRYSIYSKAQKTSTGVQVDFE